MTIIGTNEEISALLNQCNRRCVKGEWCLFDFQKDNCPVNGYGMLTFENMTDNNGQKFSVLNER